MWSCDSGTLRVGSGPGLQRPLPTPPPLLGLLMEEAQSGSVRDSLLASGGEAGLKDTWYSQKALASSDNPHEAPSPPRPTWPSHLPPFQPPGSDEDLCSSLRSE